MSKQTVSVGRVVHYVSHGTPVRADGSQAFAAECRAAVVTEVNVNVGEVGLCVLTPTGQFFNREVQVNLEENQGGTWHWPEQV